MEGGGGAGGYIEKGKSRFPHALSLEVCRSAGKTENVNDRDKIAPFPAQFAGASVIFQNGV